MEYCTVAGQVRQARARMTRYHDGEEAYSGVQRHCIMFGLHLGIMSFS